MKKSILFLSFLTTLFFTSNAQQLEVEGAIQSDSLIGNNSRLVQTNSSGEINDVPEGNLGEVLSQGATGVQWATMAVNTSPCAPTYECPTQFSATSVNTMSCGACIKYCENLIENTNQDWRTPTLDELYALFPTMPSENLLVWTTNLTFFEVLNSSNNPVNPRRVIVHLETADLGHVLPAVSSYNCKCVR